MLILGIESATNQVGCAIGGHEGVLASMHLSRGRRHAESLAPQIDTICRQAQIELSEIGVVAVDIGPGLYTGLRVGVATALALAHALKVPMIGVSSLDLVAFPLRFTDRAIIAVIDARRGEVFHAKYRTVPGGIQRVSEPAVSAAQDLVPDIVAEGEDVLLVGDGAVMYSDVFDSVGEAQVVEQGLAYPSASSLVQLAHARAMREEFVRPDEIAPMYLRRPDAEARWGAPPT